MASKRRRKPPSKDAAEHIAKALDKTTDLEVKFINPLKGRGVFSKNLFQKGDFVVEYRGKLISSAESESRRKIYHSKCTVFMFDFYWQDKLWCIDASQEDDSLGRLVNDDHKNPNCKMKKISVNGKPHLCLFALRNINPGEEITYDYGGKDWPWREKVDNQFTITESVQADVPARSDQVPEQSNEKNEKPYNSTECVEAGVPERSDQVPDQSNKQNEKPYNSTESVEAGVPERSDQVPDQSNKQDEKPYNSTECVEAGVPERSDHVPDQSNKQNSSLYDLTLLDQDQECIPRLRRTKSVVLNHLVNFDSDELFDSMTSGSGDEYVPAICEDSSDGTDDSGGDNRIGCSTSSVQVCKRGRSHTKKRKDSGLKSKIRRLNSVPSRTPQSRCDLSSEEIGNIDTEEQSTNPPYVLKDCHDKSTSQVFEDESVTTLSIPAVQKKDDGSRMYNKRQYCLYCQKGFIKMARNLERAHPQKPEVAQAMGRLAEFKGKSLDDICIEENVLLDSDEEAGCESDTQEETFTDTATEARSEEYQMDAVVPDVGHGDVEICETEQDDVRPSQSSESKSKRKKKVSKVRRPFKRRPWEEEEILAVEKHMMSFITSCRVPGKSDCDKCLQQENVALKNRNWLGIKFYVKNRITALKNKF